MDRQKMNRQLRTCGVLAWVAVALCVGGMGSGVRAGPPAFAPLPYKARPLVQAGSGNLLPSPGFASGLQGWEPKGDVTVVEVEKERCLRFGPKEGEESSHIRVYIPKPKGSVLYLLRFEVKIPPDVEFDWESAYQGLSGWLAHGVKGKNPIGPVAIRETRRSEQWLSVEFRLFSHPKTDTLYILLGFNATKGAALTRRWELVEERIEAAEGRVVFETPSGEWAQAPPAKEPKSRSTGQRKGPALWTPADCDGLAEGMLPSAEDAGRVLALCGTPGEMCVGALCLHSPAAVAKVRLAFGPISGLGASPCARRVVFHPRRTEYYGRGMTFRYMPDFFVEQPEGFSSCEAGETSAFWINLRLPKAAKAGVYEGEVTTEGTGLRLALPVRVRVYPFQLAELPDKVRHIYLDNNRWERMSDEQVAAELADVKDHGYESVTLGCKGGIEVLNGAVKSFALSEPSVRAIRAVQQAGLKGPFLFWTGWLADDLARRLGLPRNISSQAADAWPAELGAAMAQALKLARAELQKLGVADPVLVAVDEPGYWKKGSPERLRWDVKTAKDAGWPIYCTSSYPPSDPIGQNLNYHCYAGSRLTADPARAAFVAEQTRKAGQRLWYYCTGAYSGQIGNMLRNRYLAGFFFYRCGADGTASWTFQRPHGNAFDDFLADPRTGEAQTGQACITYPDPEHPGQNLDTPPWEGLRQAWHDHRYAETLRRTIETARGRDPRRADQAQKRLEELVSQLPWNGDPFLWPGMTNEALGSTRAAIAEEIIRTSAF